MLSKRQAECVELRAQGMKIREIADHLGLKEGTVKGHLKAAKEKQIPEQPRELSAPPPLPALTDDEPMEHPEETE